MKMTPVRNGFTSLVVFLALGAGIGFFSYAALQGEYGMFRLFQVRAEKAGLQRDLDALQSEYAHLENRTKRMSNDYLDLDLLDEQARRVLGMARGDEIIIR